MASRRRHVQGHFLRRVADRRLRPPRRLRRHVPLLEPLHFREELGVLPPQRLDGFPRLARRLFFEAAQLVVESLLLLLLLELHHLELQQG